MTPGAIVQCIYGADDVYFIITFIFLRRLSYVLGSNMNCILRYNMIDYVFIY